MNLEAGTKGHTGFMTTPHPGVLDQIGPTELKRNDQIRAIGINQLDHGYVVTVGCQSFAIEKASDLIAKLTEYIMAPNATEDKYRAGKLF